MKLPNKRAVVCVGLVVTACEAFTPAGDRAHRSLVRQLPGRQQQQHEPLTAPAATATAPVAVASAAASSRSSRSRAATLERDTLPDLGAYETRSRSYKVHFNQVPELLTARQELALSRMVQRRLLWERVRLQLQEELQREPTHLEWADALSLYGEAWESAAAAAAGANRSVQFAAALRELDAAKHAMISANLRLVMSIVRSHQSTKLPLSDLVQEGSLGLVKAVEKFDPERGFRFSTYATCWIRQSILRAIMDQGRSIRLPAHVQDTMRAVKRATRSLTLELDRQPTDDEIARRTGLTVEKLQWLHQCHRAEPISLSITQYGPTSLRKPDSVPKPVTFGEAIKCTDPTPADYTDVVAMQEDVDNMLRLLEPRQREVLRLRFGLDNGGKSMTLENVGEVIGVTRERVRQIERRALETLRKRGLCGDAAVTAAHAHVYPIQW